MFYLLNFNDHSFVSCDSVDDVTEALSNNSSGADDGTFLVLSGINPDDSMSPSEFATKYRTLNEDAVSDAVKRCLDEKTRGLQKGDDGNFRGELYADYRDEMDPKTAAEILSSACPAQTYAEKMYAWYEEAESHEFGEVEKQVKEALVADDPDGLFPDGSLTDEESDFVDELLRELISFDYPYDHYDKQTFCVNIVVDTGDGNYDFSLNPHYPSYYGGREGDTIDNKASIVWLSKQQGYKKSELLAALNAGDMSDPEGFLQSVRVEQANMGSHMSALVFLVKMSFSSLMKLNALIRQQNRDGNGQYDAAKRPDCGYIILRKETMTGLFDSWQGCGGPLEIKLEQDVKLPVRFIHSALPDGSGQGAAYSVGNVYSMCGSAWKDTVVEIHVPKSLQATI